MRISVGSMRALNWLALDVFIAKMSIVAHGGAVGYFTIQKLFVALFGPRPLF